LGTILTPHLPGRTVVTTSGDEYLYFSGTDYLGMGHDVKFYKYLNEGMEKYGLHYGSSRNNSLRLVVYEEAESALANFTGAPAALLVSSGMWAGQLVMKEIENIISQSGNTLPVTYHYAPRVHPAIWGNCYQANSNDWAVWAEHVTEAIRENPAQKHIICSDAVGSPWVEAFDFSIFGRLSTTENAWFIIDDSHSLGVLGIDGTGVFEQFNSLSFQNVIVVSSLNKALGLPAGAILGSRHLLDNLRQAPWFAGASPPAPASVYAFQKLLQNGHYISAYQKLSDNITYFSDRLENHDLLVGISGYPVFCSLDQGLFGYLMDNKIFTSCFSYPSHDDAPVTRLVISALHRKENLDRLAEVCNRYPGN
jgi:8-amino-7-oxononanoate synthase